MVLWYLKGQNCLYRLCPIFGVVQSTISIWLNYALEVMIRVVQDTENCEFRISWPSTPEIISSANLLHCNSRNRHLFNVIFAVIDGGRVPCVTFGDPYPQNAY